MLSLLPINCPRTPVAVVQGGVVCVPAVQPTLLHRLRDIHPTHTFGGGLVVVVSAASLPGLRSALALALRTLASSPSRAASTAAGAGAEAGTETAAGAGAGAGAATVVLPVPLSGLYPGLCRVHAPPA